MAEPVRIETDRLLLRDWREGDAEAFFAGTNTEAVMRWLGGVLDDKGQQMLLDRVGGCRAANGFCFWIVERKADGDVLGFCGIKRADAPGSTITGEFEIGWRLREEAWGQGYAKEAANVSLDAAFGRFGAETVYALTVEGNAPSWGLMKRLGMKRREELDYPDARFEPPLRDTIVYSIDRETWENRK